MQDDYKFYSNNNRVRLVGKIATAPEHYIGDKYRFFIDARVKPEKENLVPVVIGPKYLEIFVDKFQLGDRVAVYGYLNSKSYFKLDKNGVLMKIFDEYPRLQHMCHTEKDYGTDNVGIFRGIVYREPKIQTDRYGNKRVQTIFKISSDFRVVTNLAFPTTQLPYLEDLKCGDPLAVKCNLITIENVYRKTLVKPIWVFNQNENLEENPYFLDLDLNPKNREK